MSPLLLVSLKAMSETQALDRIVQYAHDLATPVQRCGEACPPEWSGNPATALAERLAETVAHPATPTPADAGDLELW